MVRGQPGSMRVCACVTSWPRRSLSSLADSGDAVAGPRPCECSQCPRARVRVIIWLAARGMAGRSRAMARMFVEGEDLVVHLSWREMAAARRGNVRVPLAAVCRVTVEANWWRALRGGRQRGLWIPGARCIGTRSHHAGMDFVVIRPGRPVVCVELRPGAPFRLLAVSVPTHGEARATAQWLSRTAPKIDTSTPCRQPLPVPGENSEGSASRCLPAKRRGDRNRPRWSTTSRTTY